MEAQQLGAISPAAANRPWGNGRSLPGRTPASEPPLRLEADPPGYRSGAEPLERLTEVRLDCGAFPIQTRSRSTTTAGPKMGLTTMSWNI